MLAVHIIQTARVSAGKGVLGLFALVEVPIAATARLGDVVVVVVFKESVQVATFMFSLVVIVIFFTPFNLCPMAARSAKGPDGRHHQDQPHEHDCRDQLVPISMVI